MAINYLFPPEEINNLPTWRFIFHYVLPRNLDKSVLNKVIEKLKEIEFQVLTFPCGIEKIEYAEVNNSISLPVEVPEAVRRSDEVIIEVYESDVWKIMGNMAGLGLEEVFYEAIDWKGNEEA